MPRIDPLQLLKCLGVLLTPNGGIRSKEEVQRLASLMMKFSKKLVSKCVYILILKNTDIELLGMFMSAGGWTLVFTWLSDGICGKNWALVSELLELLLICPVDVERLKSNSIPRLVKGLSKDESLGGVNVLATKLVEQWLKIVKDETVPEREVVQQPVIVKQEAAETSEIISTSILEQPITIKQEEVVIKKEDLEEIENESKTLEIPPQTFYKVTVRDGKQVIHKVENEETTMGTVIKEEVVETDEVSVPQSSFPATTIVPENKDTKEKVTELKEKKEGDEKKVNKERSSKHHDKKHKSSSSSSSNSSSSSKSSSHKDSNKDKSSSSSSRDKHKSRDKKHRDKEHRSNGQHKSSSNSSKENKEKQAEKDRATLAKVQPHSIDKLGKIPKKSSSSNDSKDKSKNEKKDDGTSQKHKSSISIEVRKKVDGERPKTVKVFNSKLRSTGLEEAPKPPPSRQAVKKPSATLPAVIPLKRPSPSREAPPPPEKKIKLPEPEEKQEKPGGIKLIPPKPKPAFLQESDMFMDALAASAHNKKEPKKRKRRTSVTKDNTTPTTPTSPPTSPSNPLSSPLSSPTSLKAIAPKFYKDTLETDENKTSENEEVKTNNIEEPTSGETGESEEKKVKINDDVKNESTVIKGVDGLKGVLVHHKKRGPKKSVKWRNDSELEEIQYFELDETERVNVTKTFTDMKQMEHVGEREALQLSRKLPHEDTMDERTTWKALIIIDLPPPLAEPGSKSTEKAVQYAREKNILQAIYFNKSMLPDSPAEPRHEIHNIVDPVVIPLIDVTGNPDSVNDYQNTPWPEPKGSPPHNIQNNIPNVQPNIFQGGMPQFNNALGPPNFPGPLPTVPFAAPAFGPNVMGGDWRIGDGSVMPQDVITHGPINPNMFNNRPDGFNNMMEDGGYGPNPQNFGPGPGPGGPGPGMGPGPGPMYQNFVGNRGGNRGGGFRNMNRGGWFRPSGPPPGWHGGPRGGQGWGGRGGGSAGICKQYKMQGFCRNRDSCPYMHPQGNGPY